MLVIHFRLDVRSRGIERSSAPETFPLKRGYPPLDKWRIDARTRPGIFANISSLSLFAKTRFLVVVERWKKSWAEHRGDHIKIKAVCEQQIFFSFFFFCFLLLLFTICTAREGRGGGRALLLCGNRGLVNRRYKIHRGKKQSTAIIGSTDDDDDDDAS